MTKPRKQPAKMHPSEMGAGPLTRREVEGEHTGWAGFAAFVMFFVAGNVAAESTASPFLVFAGTFVVGFLALLALGIGVKSILGK